MNRSARVILDLLPCVVGVCSDGSQLLRTVAPEKTNGWAMVDAKGNRCQAVSFFLFLAAFLHLRLTPTISKGYRREVAKRSHGLDIAAERKSALRFPSRFYNLR